MATIGTKNNIENEKRWVSLKYENVARLSHGAGAAAGENRVWNEISISMETAKKHYNLKLDAKEAKELADWILEHVGKAV